MVGVFDVYNHPAMTIQPAKLLVIILLFASCKEQNKDAQLSTIIKGLQSANVSIALNNEQRHVWFENLMHDYTEASANKIWIEKAKTVQLLTSGMLAYMDDVIAKWPQQIYAHDLFMKLCYYKTNLISLLDPREFPGNMMKQTEIKNQKERFYVEIPLPGLISDTNHFNIAQIENKWLDTTFKNASSLMCHAQLLNIKNQILLTDQMFVDYFNRSRTVFLCGFPSITAIATLNSAYVKSGDTLELFAGIGEFSAAMRPTIFVDEKKIDISESGYCEYKIRPRGKPGKRSMQVRFEYTKPDGTQEMMTKKIRYTILE